MAALAPQEKSSGRRRGLAGRIAVLAIGAGLIGLYNGAVPASATAGARMTGSGGIYDDAASAVRTWYSFGLHCDPAGLPNTLEVRWDTGNLFQLEAITSASCSDNPAIAGPASFDTHSGAGTGRLNGASGATAEWTLTDVGNLGTQDSVQIVVKNANGATVLLASGTVVRGNHQAFGS
jgi:hypothetical protein